MAQYDEKLAAIAEQLKNGVSPQGETVRAFLRWFQHERRGWRVVNSIRAALAHYRVSTKPDFEYAYIDGSISFIKAPTVDRAEFCAGLDHVRELRNDVMHFDPDGLEPSDMAFLREFAEFLRRLRTIGAV
jgi:hypothetical protein